VIVGAALEDWWSGRGAGAAVVPLDALELEIASAAANSAASSASSRPSRAGEVAVSDMRFSAFPNPAPCRTSAWRSYPG